MDKLKCATMKRKDNSSYVFCSSSKKNIKDKYMPPKKRKIAVPKATKEEREKLNKKRDKKLKEVRKGKGAGRPKKATKTKTREELNKMRDDELKRIRKELGVGAGRPKSAITQAREGMYI